MCLRLLKILWIDISFGLLVFSVCYGSLQKCWNINNVSFQVAAVLGSEFELPLCWQSNNYNIIYAVIDTKHNVKVNSNELNVWLASRANVRGHIGDQVIVFMINRVSVNDIKNHQVDFLLHNQWIRIHVNLTQSETRVTKPDATELIVPETIVRESTTRGSTVLGSTVAESTITESTKISKFESVCEDDWQFIENRCVKLFKGANWSAAVMTCQENGAKLTNGSFNRSVYKQVSSPTWINQSNGSHCSFMKKNSSSERAIRCNETRTFFCEKSQDPPNVTHFNLQTKLQGEDNTGQDLLNTVLELISVDQQATSLMFTCNASGAFNVTILNDKEIKATGISSVTYQQSLSQTSLCFDSVEYSCVSHNNFGVSKKSRKIQGTCKLQIESFFATTKTDDNLFIAEVNETGVSLRCTTNRVFYPFLKLQYKEKIIADSETSNVHYTIPQVQCCHMGEYVCKAENVRTKRKQEKTIQLAVSNCQAQLCSTIDQSKTIKAKVHDNVTVSLCLIIYPEQPTQTKLYLNETMIGQTQLFNRHSWSLDTSGHLNKTVNLYIQDIKPEDFGVQYINVEFNGYNTTMLLNIQAEGPPLCPTNFTIEEIGSDDVILSWTPGFNGGAEQKFRIVYKKLNETSQQTREVHKTSMDSLGRMNVTFDNLESNTSYEFRVTSSNRFGHQTEESGLCEGTMTWTTRKGAVRLEQQESKGDLHIGALAVAGAAVVVIIVALVAVVIKKRGIRPGQRKIIETKEDGNEYDGLTNVYANMSSSPKKEETNTELIVTSEAGDHTLEGDRNSGRYVSDQGLIYVTLAHTQSIKKPPRKVSIKKEVESVEYVTIDCVRTGLQQDEDLDKEEKSQVKGSGDLEMVDISNTAGNEDSNIERDSADANKSLESCEVDNKDDAKLLG